MPIPHDFAGLDHALARSIPLEDILVALVAYHDGPMRPTLTPFQDAGLAQARRALALVLQSILDGHEA